MSRKIQHLKFFETLKNSDFLTFCAQNFEKILPLLHMCYIRVLFFPSKLICNPPEIGYSCVTLWGRGGEGGSIGIVEGGRSF